MNDNDKELLLYRIISEKTIFYYLNEEYLLVAPSIETKYRAALIYDNIINEEKYEEWFREENSDNIMIGLGIWTIHTKNQLSNFEKMLDNLKVELFNSFMIQSKVKDIRKKIKNTKENMGVIYNSKNNFISHTLEGYANSIKNEYLICNSLYKNNKLVFDNNDSKSYTLFNNLVHHIDKNMITTEQFKELARSSAWRGYWNAGKNNIFDKTIALLTDEQKALLNISRMYDNIYEHPDCPDDSVIDDDDALDGWMILQKRKNEQDKKKAQFDTANPKLKDSGEVFVMSGSKEDASSILSMNSMEAKSAMKEKFNYISEKKTVEDGELPDVRRDVKSAIFQMKQQAKK
jgi:hypothetical protein